MRRPRHCSLRVMAAPWLLQGFCQGKGTIRFPTSGDKYTGWWKMNCRHGQGKYTWGSGNSYSGKWEFNQAHGFGIMINVFTGNRYEGNWEYNKRNGFGKLVYRDGNIYEGNWVYGQRTGKGVMRYDAG